MNLDELTKTLGEIRNAGKLATKAIDQIGQSAKALSGMDEDDLATSGGREEGRIRESARELHEHAGLLEDFAARVSAQGSPSTDGWQSSLWRR